ncbi:MAG: GNAT family N-acetyltransferase [Solirubrobacterales bacterium]
MPPRQTASSDDAIIRRATPGDAGAVARLLHDFQQEFDEPSPGIDALEERYADLIRNRDMTVLLAGEGPDGFAQIRYRPWVYSAGPQAHSYLEELYVVPSLRGRGTGRRLLKAAVDTARGEGATHMELGTTEADAAARALYESIGFSNHEGGPGGPVMLFYEIDLTGRADACPRISRRRRS